MSKTLTAIAAALLLTFGNNAVAVGERDGAQNPHGRVPKSAGKWLCTNCYLAHLGKVWESKPGEGAEVADALAFIKKVVNAPGPNGYTGKGIWLENEFIQICNGSVCLYMQYKAGNWVPWGTVLPDSGGPYKGEGTSEVLNTYPEPDPPMYAVIVPGTSDPYAGAGGGGETGLPPTGYVGGGFVGPVGGNWVHTDYYNSYNGNYIGTRSVWVVNYGWGGSLHLKHWR